MTQQFLHIPNIHAVLKNMRGKAVAQSMKTRILQNSSLPQRALKNFLRCAGRKHASAFALEYQCIA